METPLPSAGRAGYIRNNTPVNPQALATLLRLELPPGVTRDQDCAKCEAPKPGPHSPGLRGPVLTWAKVSRSRHPECSRPTRRLRLPGSRNTSCPAAKSPRSRPAAMSGTAGSDSEGPASPSHQRASVSGSARWASSLNCARVSQEPWSSAALTPLASGNFYVLLHTLRFLMHSVVLKS